MCPPLDLFSPPPPPFINPKSGGNRSNEEMQTFYTPWEKIPAPLVRPGFGPTPPPPHTKPRF